MAATTRRDKARRTAILLAGCLAALAFRSPTVRAQPATSSIVASTADSGAAAAADTVIQRDAMDVLRMLIGRQDSVVASPPPLRGISRSLLPSFGYNPNAGFIVGLTVGLGGWFGDPATTRLSAGIIGASYSTEGQTNVQFRSNFNLSRNAWVLQGDWRYLNTNQPTYGLGPTEPSQSEYPMKFLLYRLHEVATSRLGQSPFSIGLGYHFDRYQNILDRRAEQGEDTPYTRYSGGHPSHSLSSGVSLNLVYDTRDNQINARQGTYAFVSMRTYQPAFGSDAEHDAAWLELRTYRRLPHRSRSALAIWTYYWWTSGTVPYLDLPAIGWDTFGRGGRGYIQGRMRGPREAYGEVEYRRRLTKDDLLGAVAFLNVTGTSGAEGRIRGPADLGFGVGLRVKLTKRTDSNVSFDVGRGDDGVTHVFIAMQEAY